jgi:D-erythronate 2-dehydrogenase
MSRILITGAAGFLGQRLVKSLIASQSLGGQPIRQIVMTDVHPPTSPMLMATAIAQNSGIEFISKRGDLADEAFVQGLAQDGFDSLFHLASLLTLQAEADPDLAYQINVEALRRLIDHASNKPKVVFTSSIAIHGGTLPAVVSDDHNPIPATTYGTHKAINELLIADYSRLGKIDGRCLRLPIVLTRPGTPLPAVSDQVAGLLREPLNDVDVVSPLAAETPLPIVSAGAVVKALLRLHDLPSEDLPAKRALNLPSLTVTVSDLAVAAAKHGGTGRITYQPDATVQAIVDGWPQKFVSRHADRLGIASDVDLDALIRDYLHNEDE